MGLLTGMARSSRERLLEARSRVPERELRARALDAPPPPPLVLSPRGFDLIAEFKLRSPSMGDLSGRTRDPVARLRDYAQGGAAAVSVLTEPGRFDGRLEHLRLAADALASHAVPVMRKDFLVDPYQLLEARVHGASGALLIARMLDVATLGDMLHAAAELGLFVLLEAFDADDLAVVRRVAAASSGGPGQVLVGLNCRDLETLAIDFERFALLRSQLPGAWPAVAESGVQTAADAARVAALGYRLALVGTSLMQHADAAQAVATLLAAGRAAREASA